jgi:hypothetical protein
LLQVEGAANSTSSTSSDSSVVYEGDLKLLHYYLGSDRMYCLQGGLLGVPLALKTVQVIQYLQLNYCIYRVVLACIVTVG